jgi:hypothetical protein
MTKWRNFSWSTRNELTVNLQIDHLVIYNQLLKLPIDYLHEFESENNHIMSKSSVNYTSLLDWRLTVQ